MTEREPMKNDVPELWRQRAKAGLCPVCGKTKIEFKKGMKVYCSVKCRDKYASKYIYWSTEKDRFLEKHGKKCDDCGLGMDDINNFYREEVKKRRKDWLSIPKNKKRIEEKRDELLVDWSKDWEERYKKIMDDYWILDGSFWGEDQELRKGIPKHVSFDVDHIKALCNGGDMWDKNNWQVLCSECHKKKTKKDLRERKRLREKNTKLVI